MGDPRFPLDHYRRIFATITAVEWQDRQVAAGKAGASDAYMQAHALVPATVDDLLMLAEENERLRARLAEARSLLDDSGPHMDDPANLYDPQGVNQAHRTLHGGDPPRPVSLQAKDPDDDCPF